MSMRRPLNIALREPRFISRASVVGDIVPLSCRADGGLFRTRDETSTAMAAQLP